MRKGDMVAVAFGVFCAVGVSAFAAKLYPVERVITIANTSVAYPLSSSERSVSRYRLTAGQNNTGTIYVGSSAVNSTSYGTYLNAGDVKSESSDTGDSFPLDAIYIRGTVVNDTVALEHSNI